MSRTDGATATTPDVPKKVRLVGGIPWPLPVPGRDWLTAAEVADRLDVKVKRVREWMTVGVTVGEIGQRRRVLLARVGLGKQIRIYPQAVHEFLRQCSLPPCQASAPAPVESDGERAERLAAMDDELRALGVL